MDKACLDEIRDYTARECLTDAEWSALLALAYEAVAAQERIDNWKREFEKVQAKRDVYRERAEAAEAEATKLREALETTRKGMIEAANYAAKADNAALHRVAHAWLANYATRDAMGLLPTSEFPVAAALGTTEVGR